MFGVVIAVAVLLGLRHATDPDHLAAVTAAETVVGVMIVALAVRLLRRWGHPPAALAVFALFTAVSMALASTLLGYALTRRPVLAGYGTVAPALGLLSLAFGVWYALGALHAVPYTL